MIKKYSYKEVHRIITSLDLYARMYCGQYDFLIEELRLRAIIKSGQYAEDILTVKLMKLRNVLIPQLIHSSFYTSLGIWNKETPLIAKRAYDIQQILRYQMAFHDYPEGGFGVNFYEPYIHGNWRIKNEEIDKLKDIYQTYHYKERGLIPTKYWHCPIIIKSFNDDGTIDVYVYGKPVQKIIKDATKMYDCFMQKELLEGFQVLYETISDESIETIKEIQLLLKS